MHFNISQINIVTAVTLKHSLLYVIQMHTCRECALYFIAHYFLCTQTMCDRTPRRSPNSGLDALLSYTSCTALVDVNHVDSLVFDWKVQVGF